MRDPTKCFGVRNCTTNDFILNDMLYDNLRVSVRLSVIDNWDVKLTSGIRI